MRYINEFPIEWEIMSLVHILRAPSEAQMTIFLLLARKVEKEHKNNENSRAK